MVILLDTYMTGERKESMSVSCWWAGMHSTHTTSLSHGLPALQTHTTSRYTTILYSVKVHAHFAL